MKIKILLILSLVSGSFCFGQEITVNGVFRYRNNSSLEGVYLVLYVNGIKQQTASPKPKTGEFMLEVFESRFIENVKNDIETVFYIEAYQRSDIGTPDILIYRSRTRYLYETEGHNRVDIAIEKSSQYITGIIRDEENKPLEGLILQASYPTGINYLGRSFETVTSKSGAFEFEIPNKEVREIRVLLIDDDENTSFHIIDTLIHLQEFPTPTNVDLILKKKVNRELKIKNGKYPLWVYLNKKEYFIEKESNIQISENTSYKIRILQRTGELFDTTLIPNNQHINLDLELIKLKKQLLNSTLYGEILSYAEMNDDFIFLHGKSNILSIVDRFSLQTVRRLVNLPINNSPILFGDKLILGKTWSVSKKRGRVGKGGSTTTTHYLEIYTYNYVNGKLSKWLFDKSSSPFIWHPRNGYVIVSNWGMFLDLKILNMRI